MPNRIIKESIQTSDTLASISAEAERLFWRLTTAADDYGRFDARPHIVLGKCLAALIGRVTVEQVDGWLDELEKADLIQRYAVDGKDCLYLTTWDKHQRPPRAKESKYPAPLSHDSTCRQMTANAPVFENRESRIENRDTGYGNRETRAREEQPAAVVVESLKAAGILTPSRTEIDALMAFMDDDIELGVIVFATETAAVRGKRRVDYIQGILRRWRDAGVRTRAQAEAQEAQRQAAAARASPGPPTPDEYPDLTAKNAEILRWKAEVIAGAGCGQGPAP